MSGSSTNGRCPEPRSRRASFGSASRPNCPRRRSRSPRGSPGVGRRRWPARRPHHDDDGTMTTAEPTAQPVRRVRKSREERWPEIIQAATDVFAEKGYDVASLHDIADRLDMLKGSLYHYIGSKEDLLFYIIRAAHDELYETVAGLAEGK